MGGHGYEQRVRDKWAHLSMFWGSGITQPHDGPLGPSKAPIWPHINKRKAWTDFKKDLASDPRGWGREMG